MRRSTPTTSLTCSAHDSRPGADDNSHARTRTLTVVTSARRDARAPHGFGGYLANLDAELRRERTTQATAHVCRRALG
jgi:hypothetical protein